MIVICLLSITINFSGIPFLVDKQVMGKVLNKRPEYNYIVDFSEDLKKVENLAEDVEDYKHYMIAKTKCERIK